jgi:hypothetical protein
MTGLFVPTTGTIPNHTGILRLPKSPSYFLNAELRSP